MYSIKNLVLLFFIYSFIGWIIEVIVNLFEKHKLINRGFLLGPICPIYGVGCLFLTLLLYRYLDDFFIMFGMSILICSIIEYATSYIMEKLFSSRWWDYSNRKFNINGRICFVNTMAFGILGCIVLYILNPFLIDIIDKIPIYFINTIIIILLALFITDLTISSEVLVKFRKTMKIVEKDGTEEISKNVRKIILTQGYLLKRLVNAFPSYQSTVERLTQLRKNINMCIRKIKR